MFSSIVKLSIIVVFTISLLPKYCLGRNGFLKDQTTDIIFPPVIQSAHSAHIPTGHLRPFGKSCLSMLPSFFLSMLPSYLVNSYEAGSI